MKQFNNETINNLYIFCDGGARGNPGPSATGFVIKNGRGKVLVEKGEYIGRATNNVAEYQGVIHALNWLIDNQPSVISADAQVEHPRLEHRDHQSLIITFFLDSQLVVNQLSGLYKIKNAKLRELVIEVKGLENQIKGKIIYHHIPREKNKEADRLLNKALDLALRK